MQNSNNILSINNLSLNYGKASILQNISFDVAKNDWLMLIGPNGAGKSSTVFSIAKTVPFTGEIKLNDKNIFDYTNIEYAKRVGFLSQKNIVAYDFTVEEIVEMGRYSHQDTFIKSLNSEDRKAINKALDITEMKFLKNRSIQQLSGGEIQRTFIAQVLAQEPELLILDEPTNNLDLSMQAQIFDLLNSWIKDNDGTIISVVHDLGLAKAYGNSAALMNAGKLIKYGKINEVLTDENLYESYHINVRKYLNKIYSNF